MTGLKFKAFFKVDERIYEVLSIDFANEEVTLWDKETGVSFEADFDEIELMQYIGINDENGVEIYEGYIIAPDNSLPDEARVYWCEDKACFAIKSIAGLFTDFIFNFKDDVISDYFIVVGNIYENRQRDTSEAKQENPNLEIK